MSTTSPLPALLQPLPDPPCILLARGRSIRGRCDRCRMVPGLNESACATAVRAVSAVPWADQEGRVHMPSLAEVADAPYHRATLAARIRLLPLRDTLEATLADWTRVQTELVDAERAVPPAEAALAEAEAALAAKPEPQAPTLRVDTPPALMQHFAAEYGREVEAYQNLQRARDVAADALRRAQSAVDLRRRLLPTLEQDKNRAAEALAAAEAEARL